jgi:hypothetical protein
MSLLTASDADERRTRLSTKGGGKKPGNKFLGDMCRIFSPDRILRRYQKLVNRKLG